MHWFDVSVTVLVLLFGALGVWRGLIREVIALLGFLAAFVLAAHGYAEVVPLVHPVIKDEWASQAVSVVLIFMVVMLLAALCGRLLRLMVKRVGLSLLDRLLGGVFGVMKVTLVVAGLLLVSMQISPRPTRQLEAESHLAPLFFQNADLLAMSLTPQDYDAFKRLSEQALQPLEKLLLPPPAVPVVVEKRHSQPAAPPPDPVATGTTAPPPTAPIAPAARPPSVPLDTPPDPAPAGPSPPVAQGPARPTSQKEPGPADNPSSISEADRKALERILRGHFQEQRR